MRGLSEFVGSYPGEIPDASTLYYFGEWVGGRLQLEFQDTLGSPREHGNM